MSSSIEAAPKNGLYLPEQTSETRYVVFSDIHGRLALLEGAVELYDGVKNVQFVNNGDAINKGAQSKEVVQKLMDIGATCLMGNHEWLVMRAMQEDDDKEKGRFVSENFFRYFVEISESYGVYKPKKNKITKKTAITIINDLEQAIDEAGHDKYFDNLELYLDTGKLLVVHAGIKVDHKWDGSEGQKEHLDRIAVSIRGGECNWYGIPDQIMDGKDFPLAKKLIVPDGFDRVVITGHYHNSDKKQARITHGGKRVRLGGPKGDKGPLYIYDSHSKRVVEITA